jgi:hypothetical protein
MGERVMRAPSPLSDAERGIRAWLGQMARLEHEARVTHYPAQVDAGGIERGEAAADIAAWDAIARLFADGGVETDQSWAELELAAARALQRREQAHAVKPDNAALRQRRDAVWAIHERIVWARGFWTGAPAAPVSVEAA